MLMCVLEVKQEKDDAKTDAHKASSRNSQWCMDELKRLYAKNDTDFHAR